jgi:hypothetical protein
MWSKSRNENNTETDRHYNLENESEETIGQSFYSLRKRK